MYSFECLLNLEADGEGVPNAYSLTLLLTGNEAGERFHHALGFSVAMRFEGLDDLHVADATVLENDETELDDTLYILFLCSSRFDRIHRARDRGQGR